MVGHYDIWARKGAISIMGAVLHPSFRVLRTLNALTAIHSTCNESSRSGQSSHRAYDVFLQQSYYTAATPHTQIWTSMEQELLEKCTITRFD